MKTISKTFRLLGSFGLTAAVLLFSQQAMATGTDPGVTVSNTAIIDYDVNGVDQTDINAVAPDFVVDRRVDYEVTRMGTALTPADGGINDYFVDFFVTNESNGNLGFNLVAAQMITSDGDIYPGQPDSGAAIGDVDMANVRISVSAAVDPTPGTGDGPDPVIGGPTSIVDLAEDQSIRVRLYADAPATLANLAIAGLRLEATAAAPPPSVPPIPGDPAAGTNLTETAGVNVPGNVDNVFADDPADGLGIETAVDGFIVSTASLAITKTSLVISDPITGVSANAKAIPGAIIEYSIEMINSGTVAATAISISDIVDTDVTFVADAYNGGGSNISFVEAGTFCLADATDTNGDGCTFDGTTLTIAGSNQGAGNVPITVAGAVPPATTTVTVRFQVEIPLAP